MLCDNGTGGTLQITLLLGLPATCQFPPTGVARGRREGRLFPVPPAILLAMALPVRCAIGLSLPLYFSVLRTNLSGSPPEGQVYAPPGKSSQLFCALELPAPAGQYPSHPHVWF